MLGSTDWRMARPVCDRSRCEVVRNLAAGSMLPEFCSTETCILSDILGKSSVATVASSNNRCSVGRVVSQPICLYHALHRSATLCCVHAYAYNAQWVHVADRESGNYSTSIHTAHWRFCCETFAVRITSHCLVCFAAQLVNIFHEYRR
jgi:hypothetical protein